MLSSKFLLITLELEKFFTVDDGAAATTSRSASSAQRCKGNARTLSVDGNNAINPILSFCFGSKSFGRFESGPKEKDGVGTGDT